MKDVLFVCIENTGRRLMVESFMKKYAPHIQVANACIRPIPHPNDVVVQATEEAGIKIDKTTTSLTRDMTNGHVVNMGRIDRQECPALFVENMDDWAIPDPKDKSIEEVRRIRDMIEERVKEMAGSLN